MTRSICVLWCMAIWCAWTSTGFGQSAVSVESAETLLFRAFLNQPKAKHEARMDEICKVMSESPEYRDVASTELRAIFESQWIKGSKLAVSLKQFARFDR